MNTVELLRAAFELIRDEDHWTQRTVARNKEGRIIEADSPHAVKWCSVGALHKFASNEYAFEAAVKYLDRAACSLYDPPRAAPTVQVNDNRTHAEVMVMWKQAIADAEERVYYGTKR